MHRKSDDRRPEVPSSISGLQEQNLFKNLDNCLPEQRRNCKWSSVDADRPPTDEFNASSDMSSPGTG